MVRKRIVSSSSDDPEKDYVELINPTMLNILSSSGRSRSSSDFPLLQYYLTENGYHPYIKNYSDISLNHIGLMEDLEHLRLEPIYTREAVDDKTLLHQIEHGVYTLGKGYMLEVQVGRHTLESYSTSLHDLLRSLSKQENIALVAGMTMYCPSNNSPFKNPELEKQILDLVIKHKLESNSTTPCVGMICAEDGDFYIKDFYIKKDYSIKDVDLHYGEGFTQFHTKLLDRFKTDSKGLILFHGNPGTGKTFYIRSLIKDLLNIGKYVIYLPPGMVESMVDPTMMTFLSNTVMEKAEEGKSCVLLLEDAEPLLASRGMESRTSGITNLLNVTDGLLNDMLSIQVIATFNTELDNIDKALLRPERLIARKEFKKLKREDAQILADKLGIEKKIEGECSLAEIYSQSNHNEILVHEYNISEKKIGFR
jgi:hypothetical protein